jgi:catechol 2,3-dioxygenase-like lactoylglutathione lyase family enzyme
VPKLQAVYPISNEDVKALPVKEISPAVAYYESVLGFKLISLGRSTATLERDGAQIGLIRKEDHKPEEAGSLAFSVDDLDALHRELSASGANPGKFGTDEWNGKKHRTFFVREAENGYCYCFSSPI